MSHPRVCSSLAEKPRSTLNSVLADDTQGKDQPIRRLNACNFSIGACETKTMVTSRAWRCERMPVTASAIDRKSTRLNSSHLGISYAVFCLKKKKPKDKHSCR